MSLLLHNSHAYTDLGEEVADSRIFVIELRARRFEFLPDICCRLTMSATGCVVDVEQFAEAGYSASDLRDDFQFLLSVICALPTSSAFSLQCFRLR